MTSDADLARLLEQVAQVYRTADHDGPWVYAFKVSPVSGPCVCVVAIGRDDRETRLDAAQALIGEAEE